MTNDDWSIATCVSLVACGSLKIPQSFQKNFSRLRLNHSLKTSLKGISVKPSRAHVEVSRLYYSIKHVFSAWAISTQLKHSSLQASIHSDKPTLFQNHERESCTRRFVSCFRKPSTLDPL